MIKSKKRRGKKDFPLAKNRRALGERIFKKEKKKQGYIANFWIRQRSGQMLPSLL